MSYSNLTNRALLLILPFLFTGCYTQFQTFDDFPVKEDRYSDYYAWEGFEEGKASEEPQDYQQKNNPPSVTDYNYKEDYDEEEAYRDEELALEEQGIFYKDYEAERWYRENYVNKMYWEGYDVGYVDGFYEGDMPYYPYSARYRFTRYRFLPGYTGAFEYFQFYHYPRMGWATWVGVPYTSYFFGFSNLASFSNPYSYGFYYGNYWGAPFYFYNPYYSYNYAYNSYYKSKKYRRNADIYRKGPRNSGLRTRGEYRTRNGDNSINRKRTTGVTRSRSTGTDQRVRTSSSRGRSGSGTVKRNSSRTRGSKVKSSGKSRSRGSGSSVGRTRSGNNNSRGSSSSVGKSRSGNNSNSRGSSSSVGRSRSGNNSSKGSSRSRSRDYSSLSRLPGTSVRTINVSDFDGRTYSIPSRKVGSKVNRTKSRSSSGFGSFLNRSFKNISTPLPNNANSRSSYGKSRSKSSGSVTRSSSRSSRSAKVSRSSSSSRSRSSGTRSSSGSSKKRSRGNN